MAVIKDTWNVKLPCPEHTCKECLKYPCFSGIENTKSDFAKYGCKYFRK